jgi:predicted thioredoxin/glutaredoxin
MKGLSSSIPLEVWYLILKRIPGYYLVEVLQVNRQLRSIVEGIQRSQVWQWKTHEPPLQTKSSEERLVLEKIVQTRSLYRLFSGRLLKHISLNSVRWIFWQFERQRIPFLY